MGELIPIRKVKELYDRLAVCPVCETKALYEFASLSVLECMECETTMTGDAFLKFKQRQLDERKRSTAT